jgi:hypothetical protein
MSAIDFLAEVLGDAYAPGAWRVEKIDGEGGIELTIFVGPDAKDRAEEYATRHYKSWKYGRELVVTLPQP